MNNFLRALKKATQFWPSIALATACSFAVAALWGLNIGAFYPILEVTIRGKSMQQWVDDEIAASQHLLAASELKVAEIEKQRDAGGKLSSEQSAVLDDLKAAVQAETAKLDGLQKTSPWIHNFVPANPFTTISLIVVVLMVSTAVKHVCLIANEFLVGRVALDLSRDLRGQVFNKAIRMDRASFAKYGAGGFMAQMTHSTEMLANGLMATLGAAIREPLKIIACLAGAAFICWRLLLMSVIIAPVVGYLLVAVTKRIKSISQRFLSKTTSFHEVMHESLGNVSTIQAYCMEDHEEKRFAESTMMMRNFGLRYVFYSSLTKPIIEFMGIGMLGTTIVGGAYLVLNRETHLMGIPICNEPLSVSALLVFFGMLIGISDPLRKLSAVYAIIYNGSIAANAIYGIINHDDRLAEPASPKTLAGRHQVLSLDRVTFGYNETQPILKDVSLEIPFGSTIAIVGHNGSGKSTLINLLCRFYDPMGGALRFDGIDIKDMAIRDVRHRIALVNQHTELFNDTVSYNIRYARMDATDEEVRSVARQAHAHDFIESALEHGYDTIVGSNGQKLSGGQRQRIALARALLCDPEILILDEATSQIDMQSEQLIRESLAEHRGERTMIIITHREKLLELADRVFEVKNGQLVEQEYRLEKAA